MIRISIAIAMLLCTHASWAQWETTITCHEIWIDIRPVDSWYQAIPRCMDTIKIGWATAMSKHPSTSLNTCARLYQIQHVGAERKRIEVGSKVICEKPAQVTLIPFQPLPERDTQGDPIWYEAELYCTFWHGPEEDQVSIIPFFKAFGFKAQANARDIDTRENLDDRNMVLPGPTSQSFIVKDGLELIAFPHPDYQFVEWLCDDPNIAFNKRLQEQHIDSVCWPVSKSVTFTGMFKRLTSSVNNELSWESSKLRYQNGTVSLLSSNASAFKVRIADVLGRIVLVRHISKQAPFHLPSEIPPGCYFAIASSEELDTSIHLKFIRE